MWSAWLVYQHKHTAQAAVNSRKAGHYKPAHAISNVPWKRKCWRVTFVYALNMVISNCDKTLSL